MSNRFDLRVPASHSSVPGHFPGNPVVPGVVILDLVAKSILAKHPDCRVSGLPQAKFLSPLVPETEFQLTWAERTDGHIDFSCDVGNRCLAQGRMQLDEIG